MANIMANINDALSTTRNTIYSYRTLAEKAVRANENPQTGVVAALKRFFHKLEFLLKYGYLPSTDDVNGERLPPELQELRSFLTARCAGDSYVLQRNETERYRFSWQDDMQQLTVTREKFHASLVGARCGYACAGEWRAQTTQSCMVSHLFSVLDSRLAFLPKTYFSNSCKELSCSEVVLSAEAIEVQRAMIEGQEDAIEFFSEEPPEARLLNKNQKISGQQMIDKLKEAVNQVNADNKPLNYIIYNDRLDNESPWFTSCLNDLYRAPAITFNGVLLSRELIGKIIAAIVPADAKSAKRGGFSNISHVNTLPLDGERLATILDNFEQCNDSEHEREMITSVLKSPQFPLAILTVVSQSLFSQLKFVTSSKLYGLMDVTNYCTEDIENDAREIAKESVSFDITKGDDDQLFCCASLCTPYIVEGKGTDNDNGFIGAHKVQVSFVVPPDFTGDSDNMDIHSALEQKLLNLLPSMRIGITVL